MRSTAVDDLGVRQSGRPGELRSQNGLTGCVLQRVETQTPADPRNAVFMAGKTESFLKQKPFKVSSGLIAFSFRG